MAVIIDVLEDKVEISENGSQYFVPISVFVFSPQVGDQVRVYRDDQDVVLKVILDAPIGGNTQLVHADESNTPFVLGLLSVIFSGLNYLGIPVVHLAGITLGIIGLVQISKNKTHSKYKSTLILSIIGTSLGALAIIIGILYAASL